MRFTAKRLAWAIPTLIGVSLIVFITVKMVPGNPVNALLGTNATPEARAALEERLGLDKPAIEQYFAWFTHALTGDLGDSVSYQTPALPLVVDAFANTLLLAAAASAIALVLGLALGAAAAFSRSRLLKAAIDAVGLFFVSVPTYTFGVILIVYLAVAAALFPPSGMASSGATFSEHLHHMALPALCASLVPAGLIARVFRTSIEDLRRQEFVEAYRARGASAAKVAGHVIHNAVPTMLTVAGLQIGYLLSGIVFVETVFAWPGLGQLVYQSIGKRDLAVIQAGVMVSALGFVLINLFVDILRGAIDPRVRAAQ